MKDYVAVGREYLVHLREVGVERPATLLIPTFKAGISHQLKQQVLPLLNQTAFDNDFEAMIQELQRITVGMYGAQGNAGQAHVTASRHPQAKKGKWLRRGPELRTCYVCGQKGHLARACPNRQAGEDAAPQKGPVMLCAQGTNRLCVHEQLVLFDSGATHHIVNRPEYLKDMRRSETKSIRLGGGEEHHVMGEGELLIHSPDCKYDLVLTNVLCVPTLGYNLCSGAQLTKKVAVCTQKGAHMVVLKGGDVLLRGDRVNRL